MFRSRAVRTLARALRFAASLALLAIGPARADGVPGCPAVFQDLAGVATWYTADGTGACGFAATGDLLVTAVALPDWNGSAHCGQCLEVWGPEGRVVVRVVDQCPECPSGHLDLSYQAFDAIANPVTGVVPIAFRSIECPVTGTLAIVQKNGSNVWWLALQARNGRYAVAGMEARQNGSSVWQPMARQDYNYFLVTATGPGLALPLDLRITDLHGHVMVENDLVGAVVPGQVVAGSTQLPACGGVFLDGFETHTLAPLWSRVSP